MKFDPRYVAARKILLDAFFALAPHGHAIILCGAQAIYLHTGEGDLAIAPYTTDGDLAINPSLLNDLPHLEEAMRAANFELQSEDRFQPGIWMAPAEVDGVQIMIPVDLIVPDGVAQSGGRRGARLGVHGNRAARRTVGLEAALLDHLPMKVESLDPLDRRSILVEVAGIPALLIAKAHKIKDRIDGTRASRVIDKDAADIFRMMQRGDPAAISSVLRNLAESPSAGETTVDAISILVDLF
ncbi:MAG: hypothetical protein HKL80_11095 [Acidimicrobiales bacterium]|nr:hypothetical protein [Acidimicrobiales bacterium]